MTTAVVNDQAARQLGRGQVWIYQNQVLQWQGQPAPGELVKITNAQAQCLGYGYANLTSVIVLRRLYSSACGQRYHDHIDEALELGRKLDRARSWRQKYSWDSDALRLVWSEADGLPGLIIDQYGQVVVMQCLTAGMELRKPWLLEWVKKKLQPQGVYERSDMPVRGQEDLDLKQGWLWRQDEKQSLSEEVIIHEGPAQYSVNVALGHKTGFYLDQRASRRHLRQQSGLGEVLDCFANTGGFTMAALAGDARQVTAVEQSQEALRQLERNTILNHGHGRVNILAEDVFRILPELLAQGRAYDTVILDPPPFAKNQRAVAGAQKGYLELHRMALRLLKPKGFLMTCNCSHHISGQQFKALVVAAARRLRRAVHITAQFGPDQDHPVKSQLPQSAYLTTLCARVD